VLAGLDLNFANISNSEIKKGNELKFFNKMDEVNQDKETMNLITHGAGSTCV